jgi:cytochrome c553
MKKSIACLLWVALVGAAVVTRAAQLGEAAPKSGADADTAAAAKVAVELCSACHGPGGNSISPTFPKLAGQQPAYLAAQLRAFKSRGRADPEAHDYMWGIAATIPDNIVEPLAQYFASQPPPRGVPGDPKRLAQGKEMYETGLADRKIAACGSCHGPNGEGNSIFPRLAGQHKEYLIRQIQVIQSRLRESPIMHGVVTELKPVEIAAVAEYLESK